MCVAIFSSLRQQPLARARGQYSNFKGQNLIFVAFKKGLQDKCRIETFV